MRFGIVLPTWIYNAERARLATEAFDSLARTECPSRRAALLLLVRPGIMSKYTGPVQGRLLAFETQMLFQGKDIEGTEQTLAWGTEEMLRSFGDVTHVVWMGDDALFHPRWLRELENLVKRHPGARAWSVYHSAHQAHHKDLRHVDGLECRLDPCAVNTASDDEELTCETKPFRDVLVKSVCGHGMTFTREEWAEWGIKWETGRRWNSPEGNTLDLHHAWARPGERWVTARSYVEHTGKEGINCRAHIPEYGIGFTLED